MFLVIITGVFFGEIKFGKFQFGISGTLFTGLFFGWLAYWVGDRVPETAPAYDAVQGVLNSTLVSSQFFDLFLIIFIAAVGLLAAKDILPVMKKFGAKFILIGILTTFVGFAMTYSLTLAFSSGTAAANPYQVSGVYTGALTSSPGLAAAIETSKRESLKIGNEYSNMNTQEKQGILDMISPDQKIDPANVPALSNEQIEKYSEKRAIDVGIGHAVAYPFGVIIVILAMSLFPRLFKIRIEKEWESYNNVVLNDIDTGAIEEQERGKFNIIAFFIVALLGYLIGSVTIPMGPLGTFSFGSVGGTLIIALVLGSRGKVFHIDFRMDEKILAMLRQISLGFLLGIVGLRSGEEVVSALTQSGLTLAIAAVIIATTAATCSFLFGRYVLKLNWILLSGAICGGMTSTPGLGAAVDALKSDKPASGYGAVYPFALLTKVILVIVLHKLPM